MTTGFLHTKPLLRVVQYNKKRYSLRLEQLFWDTLHDLASSENKRVGQIVAELAAQYSGNNFSSYVRVYCLLTIQRLSSLQSKEKQSPAADIFKTSPSPGLIINHNGIIIEMNNAFNKWMGMDKQFINGQFTDFFTPLRGRSLVTTLELMAEKRLKRTEIPINYTRNNTQKQTSIITILDLNTNKSQHFRALVWFNTQPALRIRLQ